MMVEVSTDEAPFYGGWDVNEYLEVDPEEASVRVCANRDAAGLRSTAAA